MSTPVRATSDRLLYTAREAAARLSISERMLYKLTHAGEVPCVRIGRAVRYRLADLDAWVVSRVSTAGPAVATTVSSAGSPAA